MRTLLSVVCYDSPMTTTMSHFRCSEGECLACQRDMDRAEAREMAQAGLLQHYTPSPTWAAAQSC